MLEVWSVPIRLQLAVPGLPVRLFESNASSVSLGRGAGNMLQMDNPHVSTHHGRIDINATGVTFTDLGSTNGSMILRADQKLPAPGRRSLGHHQGGGPRGHGRQRRTRGGHAAG